MLHFQFTNFFVVQKTRLGVFDFLENGLNWYQKMIFQTLDKNVVKNTWLDGAKMINAKIEFCNENQKLKSLDETINWGKYRILRQEKKNWNLSIHWILSQKNLVLQVF